MEVEGEGEVMDNIDEIEDKMEQGTLNVTDKVMNSRCTEYIRCSKSYANFCVQVGIGMSILVFCMVQLSLASTCDQQSLYLGMIGIVVGYFLPNPRMDDKA